MVSKDEVTKIRKMVSQAKERRQRSQGVLEELTRELKDVWECASVEEGHELLEEMKGKLEKLQAAADKEYAKFKEQWDEYAERA